MLKTTIKLKELLPLLQHDKDYDIKDFTDEYELYNLLVHKSFDNYDMDKFIKDHKDKFKVYRIGNGIYENQGLTAMYAVTWYDHIIFTYDTNYNGDKNLDFYQSGKVVLCNMFKIIEKYANIDYTSAFEKLYYSEKLPDYSEFFAIESYDELHRNDDSHYLFLDKNAVMREIVDIKIVDREAWREVTKLDVTYLDENGNTIKDTLVDDYLRFAFIGFVYQDMETIKSKFANRCVLDFDNKVYTYCGKVAYSKKAEDVVDE